jgi:hypothetical protein
MCSQIRDSEGEQVDTNIHLGTMGIGVYRINRTNDSLGNPANTPVYTYIWLRMIPG